MINTEPSSAFPSVTDDSHGVHATDPTTGLSREGDRPHIPKTRLPSESTARVYDLALALLAAFLVILLASMYWNRGVQQELTVVKTEVAKARQHHATLERRAQSQSELLKAARRESDVPAPSIETRDAHFIGQHAELTWTYQGASFDQHVNFKVELVRAETSDGNEGEGCSTDTRKLPEYKWTWSQIRNCRWATTFLATDPANKRTRVPSRLDVDLPAGTYFWRVTPVTANPTNFSDEGSNLTEWSPYSSFTLYESVRDRVVKTGRIRVGTNLEQNSNFSRRDEHGGEKGYEITLIRLILEACVTPDINTGHVTPAESSCRHHLLQGQEYARRGDEYRVPEDQRRLLVEFVPVGKWGDWESMLKAKDIDMFAGTVTKSKARERGGIRFTRGYFPFETKMFAPRNDNNDARTVSVTSWLSRNRVVGVVAGSTNEMLLTELQKRIGPKLNKQTFVSYPELESAMDKGKIDALMIDETFIHRPGDWTIVVGWESSPAVKSYRNALGLKEGQSETLSIATVNDSGEHNHKDEVFDAVNAALAMNEVHALLQPLCQVFWGRNGNFCDLVSENNLRARGLAK